MDNKSIEPAAEEAAKPKKKAAVKVVYLVRPEGHCDMTLADGPENPGVTLSAHTPVKESVFSSAFADALVANGSAVRVIVEE
jgi:hypothetical protein